MLVQQRHLQSANSQFRVFMVLPSLSCSIAFLLSCLIFQQHYEDKKVQGVQYGESTERRNADYKWGLGRNGWTRCFSSVLLTCVSALFGHLRSPLVPVPCGARTRAHNGYCLCSKFSLCCGSSRFSAGALLRCIGADPFLYHPAL